MEHVGNREYGCLFKNLGSKTLKALKENICPSYKKMFNLLQYHRHSLSRPYKKLGTQMQNDDNLLRAMEITDYPKSHFCHLTFAPPKVYAFLKIYKTHNTIIKQHLLSGYYMQDIILTVLHELSLFTLPPIIV